MMLKVSVTARMPSDGVALNLTRGIDYAVPAWSSFDAQIRDSV